MKKILVQKFSFLMAITSILGLLSCHNESDSVIPIAAPIFDIPRNGLVAFYPFNGDPNDVSGNNLNGTLGAGTTAPVLTTDRFGKDGQAYLFDGVDDFISMGNPSKLQIVNTQTISGWFKFKTFSDASLVCKIYFDFTKGGNPTGGYHISQDRPYMGDPVFGLTSYNSTGTELTFSGYLGSPITLDEWIFICVIFDGPTLRFYQDGSKKYEQTLSETILTGGNGNLGNLTIGTYGRGSFFNGLADDIIIYDRALSDDEVIQLFNQTITMQ